MKLDNTPWHPVPAAAIRWNESGDPSSSQFEDVYYTQNNGLEESRHVFLTGNRLPERCLSHPGSRFCIAETGFGTGLNFLVTWQAWRALPDTTAALRYLSVEKSPLSHEQLARALAAWPELESLARELLDQYPGLLPGQHRILLDSGRILLDLWWHDANDALPDLASTHAQSVDAWYLDGFAPSRNASMWSPEVMHAVGQLSRPGATFATFTAAGQVRRDLAEAGFKVNKVPGYGRKRESLRGTMESARVPVGVQTDTPWDLPRAPQAEPMRVLVVGGGLAGCVAAAALARRGIPVTILDKGPLASAGSGNDQGILYTRLSHKHSALTDFSLQSFRFASSYYRNMFRSGQLKAGCDGDLCGSFHQSDNPEEMAAMTQLLSSVPELAQVLDRNQARKVLGVDQPSGGYWYPGSGWLRPASVCRALIADARIELVENCGELRLEYVDSQWHACAGTELVASAPCAVIAAGTMSPALANLDWLKLQTIRGQTTDLPSIGGWARLSSALCHSGYIAPARDGFHCIGATFELQDTSTALRDEEHRINLEKLASAVPEWRTQLTSLNLSKLDGRVAFRCASPDYLPLVGPVPDLNAFLQDYAALRKNARQTIPCKGSYMPGLYLSTAHGSRGLTATPLASELLASQICGELPPCSRELRRALAPARFVIRDLCRNRV